MDGRNSGRSESFKFILPISCTKPSAETCVGIVIISRMKVRASVRPLKRYA